MTNLEYVKQLPGCEDFTFYAGVCPEDLGLDETCCGECAVCENAKATINGEPAPYLFNCPVKPGQKVYFARHYCGTTEDEVINVTFYEEDGEIKWEACNDVDELFGNGKWMATKWNEEVFATREEAEKAVKERTKNGDQ